MRTAALLCMVPLTHAHEWYGYSVSNGVYELLGLFVIVCICVWCMLPQEQVVPSAVVNWPRIERAHRDPEYGLARRHNDDQDVMAGR